jgi:hypothetical protein
VGTVLRSPELGAAADGVRSPIGMPWVCNCRAEDCRVGCSARKGAEPRERCWHGRQPSRRRKTVLGTGGLMRPV